MTGTMLLTFVYAATMFLSAAILFVAQPMVARMVLPTFGGSPAVWTTCMLFFQAALLAGYLFAHRVSAMRKFRYHVLVHGAMMLTGVILLSPLLEVGTQGLRVVAPVGQSPVIGLLGILLTWIGLPIVAVSATAPLLQHWYSRTLQHDAREPYFLYAASNAGSLAALVAYPLVIEPHLSLGEQAWGWAIGYGVLVASVLACALIVGVSQLQIAGAETKTDEGSSTTAARTVALWIVLAFVPSSLMLGVTAHLSTDIAAVPLLWVVPLGLYLLSFIITFARRPIVSRKWPARLLPYLVMALAPSLAAGLVQWFWIPVHLLVFFCAALACHGELSARRPPARNLTTFYLALAIGGVLGGGFNALVAPLIFDRLAEYPLMIVAACLLVGWLQSKRAVSRRDLLLPLVVLALIVPLVLNLGGWAESVAGAVTLVAVVGLVALAAWTHRSRSIRFALTVGAVWLGCGLSPGLDGRTLLRERNFFGTMRITQDDTARVRRMFHGNTLHGQQSLDPVHRDEPQAYFTRSGPIGQVFEVADTSSPQGATAVVGLGAGILASYARPGQSWSFYEIDPAVARVAQDTRFFTFLHDSRADSIQVLLGDGRLQLRSEPAHRFRLIVLDAFSSDAVPVHLLTREAVELDLSKLTDGGLLVFNLTNRYLDLSGVVGALARAEGLSCRVRYDIAVPVTEKKAGKQPSIWAVMARSEADLGPIASDPRWVRPRNDGRPWTDSRSDLVRYIRLKPVRPQ